MSGRLESSLIIENSIEEKLKEMPSYVFEWYLLLKASKNTVKTRRTYVNYIHNYLYSINKNISSVEFKQITFESVINYYISKQTRLDKNGKTISTSDSYQICMWHALDSFFSYLYSQNYIAQNFMTLIHKPKNKDLDKINSHRTILTKEDFKTIINGFGEDDLDIRDKAIMMLFMSTGMRRSALKDIDLNDINYESKTLEVIDKGNKIHVYPLNPITLNSIIDWINIREYYNVYHENALFLTYQGKRISENAIYNMICKRSKEFLNKHIKPHALRAGFCTILYNETNDIELVRRAVGHSNVSTTQRYIVTNGTEKIKASNIMNDIFDNT